jgi:hypothetical protein
MSAMVVKSDTEVGSGISLSGHQLCYLSSYATGTGTGPTGPVLEPMFA